MNELKGFQLGYKPYQVICRAGEKSNDLYYLESGKLLVCTVSGTKVTALARVNPGEFIGELSFFDNKERASHVVALEHSRLVILSQEEILPNLPKWYVTEAKDLTRKIRRMSHVATESNLRKFTSQDEKPLTIDEQRYVLQALSQDD
jgi:CRP-like cAMP-binding protein